MKQSVTFGPRGVRALVALCAHVDINGNFAIDGKRIARAILGACGAEKEVATRRKIEALAYDGGRSSLKRLRQAWDDLNEKT